MKGSHRIIVESRKVKYDFTVKRNITILTGDSGSGKTVLMELIRDYRRYGADSGVQVSCDCECRTIENEDWERTIQEASPCIFFIDEGNRFLYTKNFARAVQQSEHYFVIATREKLPMLPYSMNEIYGFRKSGKFHEAKQTYNEIYRIYGDFTEGQKVTPEFVITEDSNSGYDFFKSLADKKEIPCISAKGKSNIISTLQERKKAEDRILVIVDGAAFGAEAKDVVTYLKTYGGALYAPESFEWMILTAGVIPGKSQKEILAEPENYIESAKFVSWERFFTDLLITETQNDPVWAYSKKKLPSAYLSAKVMTAMQKVMDEYAGGISTHYQFNEKQLALAKEKIEKIEKLAENVNAGDMHELMFVYELKERLTVCKSVIAHLFARKETRWHSFDENLDYPKKSGDWLKYVNSKMEDGKITVFTRKLVGREEHYEHHDESGAL